MVDKFTGFGQQVSQPVEKLSFEEQKVSKRSEKGLQEKVDQTAIALQGSMDRQQIDNIFRGGREETLRKTIQDKERLRGLEVKNNLMQDILATGDTSEEMMNVVMALGQNDLVSPKAVNTAIEREYARNAVNTTVATQELEDEIEEDPETSYQLMDGTQEAVTKAAILKDIMDQKTEEFAEFGLVGKGLDIGKTFVPFLDWYAKQNAVNEAPTSSILLGNNVEEQVEYLWSLPPEEFKDSLEAAVSEINDISTTSAISFLQAVVSYSGTDKFIDNAIAGLETVGVVAPATRLAGVGKGLLKANLKSGTTVADVAEEVGDTTTFALDKVARQGLFDEGLDADNLNNVLPAIFDVDKVLTGDSALGQAKLGKLKAAMKQRAEEIMQVARNRTGIDRIAPEELAVIAKAAEEDLFQTFNHVQDSILDMGPTLIVAEDTLENVNKVAIRFGRPTGDLFESQEGARRFAQDIIALNTNDFAVKSKGGKYYVEVTRNVGEQGVRNLELPTQAQTPQMLFRGLRSDSYLVSPEQVGARATATTYAERVGLSVETLADPIRTLSNSRAREVEDILAENNTFVDKATGLRGRFFNLAEFEQAFQERFNKLPTDAQANAYMAFRQINDLDYMLRDSSVVKQKAALGIEKISFRSAGEEGIKEFEGRVVDTLPTFESDFTRIVVLDDAANMPIMKTHNKRAADRARLQEYLDDGYRIIQVADQRLKLGEDTFGYVLMKAFKRDKVNFGNLPYRPGGHVIPRTPHMVKQPVLRKTEDGRTLYLGDTTVAFARSAKQAREIAETLDEARELVKNGDPRARKFVEERLPFTSWENFNKMVASGRINPDTKMVATRQGARTVDTQGTQGWEDITRNEHNIEQQISGKFLGERGVADVDTLRSEEDALFKVEESSILRPFQALNIGLNSAVNERVMGDYVLKSVDRFYREFGGLLDISERDFKNNGIYHLLNPAFKADVPREARTAALNMSQAVRNMIGVKTEFSKNIDALKEKIVSLAFDKFGEKGFEIVSERMLPTVNDPTVFFRSVAFHTKLGLFNPKQLFLQSQIVAHVAAIGGVKNAVNAGTAYTFSKALGMTGSKEMIERAGERISKLGWKKDDFVESHSAMEEIGWHIVGGDTAWRDDYRGADLFKGTIGRTLDTGLTFFRNGEQIGRIMAWHSAYLAWRQANPTARLNRAAKERILVRARDLTANMTREQSAWWQRGFLSAPTQFWGFQARVFEQFWGNRLTPAEKLRLFGGISLMYGVPVGMGAATFAVPFNEIIRKWQIEAGIDDEEFNDNPIFKAVRDGIVSGVIEMATGSDFDTAPYGAAGLPIVKDIIRGETDVVELVLGASGSISRDIITNAKPFLQSVWSATNMDPSDDDLYPITPESILDAFSDISTVNNSVKLWKAINTGKWISKNENAAGDISVRDAVLSSITGLELRDFTDTYLRLESVKDVRSHVQGVTKEITRDYKRALRHAQSGEWELHDKIMVANKAKALANGLTLNELNRAYLEGYNPKDLDDAMIEQIDKQVYERNQRKVTN